jgi:hypothetical protein
MSALGQQFADVQCGNGGTSFIKNDRWDLGNKAGAALESHALKRKPISTMQQTLLGL